MQWEKRERVKKRGVSHSVLWNHIVCLHFHLSTKYWRRKRQWRQHTNTRTHTSMPIFQHFHCIHRTSIFSQFRLFFLGLDFFFAHRTPECVTRESCRRCCFVVVFHERCFHCVIAVYIVIECCILLLLYIFACVMFAIDFAHWMRRKWKMHSSIIQLIGGLFFLLFAISHFFFLHTLFYIGVSVCVVSFVRFSLVLVVNSNMALDPSYMRKKRYSKFCPIFAWPVYMRVLFCCCSFVVSQLKIMESVSIWKIFSQINCACMCGNHRVTKSMKFQFVQYFRLSQYLFGPLVLLFSL